MPDRGELQLAIIQLKLGRNAEAAATASRLIARSPDASIEQNARLVEGKALIALGNPQAAYAQLMELRIAFPHADTDAEARSLAYAILIANFPASQLAPGAMLRIGRSFEEQKRFDDARAEYRRLTARYPNSDSAADARFRGPWTLYQAHRYQEAAAGFEQARAHANQPS